MFFFLSVDTACFELVLTWLLVINSPASRAASRTKFSSFNQACFCLRSISKLSWAELRNVSSLLLFVSYMYQRQCMCKVSYSVCYHGDPSS